MKRHPVDHSQLFSGDHVHQGRHLSAQQAAQLDPAQHDALFRVDTDRPHHKPFQQGRGGHRVLYTRFIQDMRVLLVEYSQHAHNCDLLDALRACLSRAYIYCLHICSGKREFF